MSGELSLSASRERELECGPLSSSSESDDNTSELDTADTPDGEEEDNEQSILSDLDSLTEPSIDGAAATATASAADKEPAPTPSLAAAVNNPPVKLDQLPVSLSSEVPSQEPRSLNAALEDELMLLRLLDIQTTSDRSQYGAVSLDSSNIRPEAAAPRPGSASARNPIITADSIINTLQMEMATVGLTAAAINAATRHLDTTVADSGARQSSTVIAPRPSLARLDVMDPVSSLPDNLASLLVSDQTSPAQFSSLLASTDSSSRQSRLASMFSPEVVPPLTVSNQDESIISNLHEAGGRSSSLISTESSQVRLNNLTSSELPG